MINTAPIKDIFSSVKKPANISIAISDKAITNVISTQSNVNIDKKYIDGAFMGENNKIPVFTMYVDSYGDLVKMGRIGHNTYIEIEPCVKNVLHLETLRNMVHIESETHIIKQPTVRKAKTEISADMVKLCKVTLGSYRSYMIDRNDIKELNIVGQRLETPIDNKIVYESVIYCSKNNVNEATKLIKNISKVKVVEWY